MRRVFVLAVLGLLGLPAWPCVAVSPQVWRTSGNDWQAIERDSVGVTSDGRIRLARGVAPVKDLETGVIWSLLRDGDAVLAATGDSGKLYRIASNKVEEVGSVLEPEITALGRDAGGKVLAGGSPDGAVYRWDGKKLGQVAD
ncbi:MAG TPA: hypothetical protein VFP10_13450, partial [Candidatus Eisenbacteria bacterium]|nr:hypothetical protein [Candidatus Eisenbacteria bacterium]